MKLGDKIIDNFRLDEKHKKALLKIGLDTIQDLLFYFPTRYTSSNQTLSISEIGTKQQVTFFGTIKKIKTGRTFRGHRPMAEATITDGQNNIKVIWFNQPYIAKLFGEGSLVRIDGQTGKQTKSGTPTVFNPQISRADEMPTFSDQLSFEENNTGDLYSENADEIKNKFFPIYPETKGVTSNWFYHALQKILKSDALEQIVDPIPENILKKYSLPKLKTALIWIHCPQKESDALAARKRFAFEEIFYIQVAKQKDILLNQKLGSPIINKSEADIEKFIKKFGFQLTKAQQKAIKQIADDLKKGRPMSRLLEGDVGSGKTAVAAVAVWATVTTNPKDNNYGHLQAAYMAPTEILAKQHFESFIELFKDSKLQIGLLTGSGCYKFPSKTSPDEATKISKTQLLKWVENGEIPILIGTHALIQKNVNFKNLGLIVIDEQHRFGTAQRQKLSHKTETAPHLLSMTATPIPRTLALTIYGDLDLTLLDEMPADRKPIITEIVTPNSREETYEKIRTEIKAGRQAYVICPRINEPDPEKQFAIYAKSVKTEAERLNTEIFPEFQVDILHSKMKPNEKEKIMREFQNGEIQILVSTSVVEVGVNVPNATNIIIEGAERFGLAQLHQLRGRVLRSNHQAYCYIFTDSKNEMTLERLEALIKAKNGFELSEYDLKLRGAGELIGSKQWGISDLGMEAIKNLKMVEAARIEAAALVKKDSEFSKNPQILEKITTYQNIHFE